MRILAILFGLAVASAQPPIYKTDVDLVRMLVTVKNSAGELIGSLDRGDFSVTDCGAPPGPATQRYNSSSCASKKNSITERASRIPRN